MTKREWLTCTDPQAMLRFRRGPGTARQWLMLALAARCPEIMSEPGASEVILNPRTMLTDEDMQEIEDALHTTDPAERSVRCDLIRCVIPYRRVKPPPAWLTRTVAAIAQRARYGPGWRPGKHPEPDHSVLPILADALQDAGCWDEVILAHCRGGGPHCFGCWVVEMCVGKR